MRFRHAPLLLLAAASLLLVAATPATSPILPSLLASPTASSEATGFAAARQGIVAMTSGAVRTGSAVMVSPGLWMTSTHVVNSDPKATNAMMTVSGELLTFEEITRDKDLGIVLLKADVPGAKPLQWGQGRTLIADDKVSALGIGSGNREVIEQDGLVKSSAAAYGGDLLLTDIKMDPLVEGGGLVTPDGKLAGVVVARGQGALGGQLGWAVTSEAAKQFVTRFEAEQAAARAAQQKKATVRWVKIAGLAVFAVFMGFLGYRFRRWYKAMEAREEAAALAGGAYGGDGAEGSDEARPDAEGAPESAEPVAD